MRTLTKKQALELAGNNPLPDEYTYSLLLDDGSKLVYLSRKKDNRKYGHYTY